MKAGRNKMLVKNHQFCQLLCTVFWLGASIIGRCTHVISWTFACIVAITPATFKRKSNNFSFARLWQNSESGVRLLPGPWTKDFQNVHVSNFLGHCRNQYNNYFHIYYQFWHNLSIIGSLPHSRQDNTITYVWKQVGTKCWWKTTSFANFCARYFD